MVAGVGLKNTDQVNATKINAAINLNAHANSLHGGGKSSSLTTRLPILQPFKCNFSYTLYPRLWNCGLQHLEVRLSG